MKILERVLEGYSGAKRWLFGENDHSQDAVDFGIDDRSASRGALPVGRFPGVGPLPAETGPLEVLAGRRILVLCDVENLSYGARDLGYRMSYRRLARMLRGASWHCELHAVFSDELGREGRIRYFSERGWTPHVHPIETVHTCRGPERLANSDNLILLTAAWLASRTDADLIVLASGDGTLVCDIARFLTLMLPGCLIASLSLVGSTSTRLDTMRNPDLAANLAVGMDVLRRSDSLDSPHGRSNHRWERLSERVTKPRAQAYYMNARRFSGLSLRTP